MEVSTVVMSVWTQIGGKDRKVSTDLGTWKLSGHISENDSLRASSPR